MSSKPFHTSSKEPMSVKLRGLNASKSVTRQLEIDSRRMEERLRELKVAMGREKQERERQGSAGSGSIWSSGKPGALTTHGNGLVNKKSPSKPTKKPGESKIMKIKVLKDTPIEVPKRKVKKYPAGDPAASVRKSFSGPACGQCEDRAVALTCMECGENYCAACFAKFHLKGALRQHRSIPYQSGSKENSPQNSIAASEGSMNRSKPSNPKTTSGVNSHSMQSENRVVLPKTSPPQNPSPNPGNSVFDGEYNEEESAASFAAALAEWRQGKKGDQQTVKVEPKKEDPKKEDPKKHVHDMGSGTTAVDDDMKPVEISFHDNPSLSYADRLLLKKHRRTELPSSLSPTPSHLAAQYLHSPRNGDLTNGHYDPTEEELEMEEEHQRYSSVFAGSQHTPPEMERPKSNVTIVEVTDEDTVMERDIEIQSVYSIQEWDSELNCPSPFVTVVNSGKDTADINISELKENHDPKEKAHTSTISSKPTPSLHKNKSPVKDERTKSTNSGKSASAVKTERAPSSKAKKQEQKQTNSALRKDGKKTPVQSARGEKPSGKVRDTSKVGEAKKATSATRKQPDSARRVKGSEPSNQGRKSQVQERPPSAAGITTAPSSELKEISKMRVAGGYQQGYKEGLGSFFMGGVDGDGDKNDGGEREEDELRTDTPTNVLPECSYQGPSAWRPDSSLSNHPDQSMAVFSPSPPKQARDTKSPGLSGRKRSSINNTATGNNSSVSSPSKATPRAMSSKPQSGLMGRSPRRSPQKSKVAGSQSDSTMHWRLSEQEKAKRLNLEGVHSSTNSASNMPPRSSSRIEVDGDDLSTFDDEDQALESARDDAAALEQLTWELASNEGRITADGRISSMSLIQDLDDENILLLSEELQDQALGIAHDDGLGSGLSTPCNDLSLDRLSDEELRSDFEIAADNQKYKAEVQALDN